MAGELQAKVKKARQAGYSEAQIVSHLAKTDQRVAQAKQAGYSDAEILGRAVAADMPRSGVGFLDRSTDKRMGEYYTSQSQGRANRAARAQGKNPIFQFGKDFAAPAKNALAGLKEGYQQQTTRGPARSVGDIVQAEKQDLQMMGNALGLVVSPLTGALDALAFKPAARGLEQLGLGDEQGNANALNTAMLAMKPGIRGAPAPRPTNALAPRPITEPAHVLATRGNRNTAAMRAEAQRMREAGVEPTFTDVSGERGRRLVRAAGARTPAAGEVLQGRAARVSSTTKPAVMARTRQTVRDPRTVDQLASDLRTARETRARTQYGPAYAEPVTLTPEAVAALRGPDGQAAIQRAIRGARARQDYNTMSELEGLLTLDLDQLSTVSAGALDRVRIAMGERGAVLRDRGSRDIASGLFQRQSAIDGALDAAPGLAPARKAYRETTQAINVAEGARGARPDVFSTDPADYARWVQSLSPEAVQANRVAIRQDILDTLGGQRANTFGSIDELATSEYARDNLRAALGTQEADNYLANLRARLEQTRNATFVSPNAQSRTAVLENDLQAFNSAEAAGRAVGQVARGDLVGAAWTAARNFLSTRGISDDVAEEIAKLASDPARLEEALQMVENAIGRRGAAEFLQQIRQVSGSATVGALEAAGINQTSSQPPER